MGGEIDLNGVVIPECSQAYVFKMLFFVNVNGGDVQKSATVFLFTFSVKGEVVEYDVFVAGSFQLGVPERRFANVTGVSFDGCSSNGVEKRVNEFG